jgi:uncharacterized protein YuzE
MPRTNTALETIATILTINNLKEEDKPRDLPGCISIEYDDKGRIKNTSTYGSIQYDDEGRIKHIEIFGSIEYKDTLSGF